MTSALHLTKSFGAVWHWGYGSAFCPALANFWTPGFSLSTSGARRLLLSASLVASSPRSWQRSTRGAWWVEPPDCLCRGSRSSLKMMPPWKRSPAQRGHTAIMEPKVLPPASLKFATQCPRSGTKRHLPAMLNAIMTNLRQVGLHRTYPAGLEACMLDVRPDVETYSAFAELRGRKEPVAFANAVRTTRASTYSVSGPTFVTLLLNNPKSSSVSRAARRGGVHERRAHTRLNRPLIKYSTPEPAKPEPSNTLAWRSIGELAAALATKLGKKAPVE